MHFQHHVSLTFGALRRWFIAQCYDCLIVGALWMTALLVLNVPLAIFWAIVAALFQLVPHFGPLLALIGPAFAMLFAGAPLEHWLWLLGAYALITVLDGLLLQPYLMRRQNRVPLWASLLVPLIMGIVLPFWGVILAPPLLAVVYAYRSAPRRPLPTGEQQFSDRDQGIILPPENQSRR